MHRCWLRGKSLPAGRRATRALPVHAWLSCRPGRSAPPWAPGTQPRPSSGGCTARSPPACLGAGTGRCAELGRVAGALAAQAAAVLTAGARARRQAQADAARLLPVLALACAARGAAARAARRGGGGARGARAGGRAPDVGAACEARRGRRARLRLVCPGCCEARLAQPRCGAGGPRRAAARAARGAGRGGAPAAPQGEPCACCMQLVMSPSASIFPIK